VSSFHHRLSRSSTWLNQQARVHTLELQHRPWLQLLPATTSCSSSSSWETRVSVSHSTASTAAL
jgi:hypothetical protein